MKNNKNGRTALMYASQYSNTSSNIECINLLLDHCADINVRDECGWSALMYALAHINSTSSIECVKLLLEKLIKISETELEHVMKTKNEEIIIMSLKKYGIENLSENDIEKYKDNECFVNGLKLLLMNTIKISSKELEILMKTNNEEIISMSLEKYGIDNLSEKEIEKYKDNEYFKKLVLM